MHYFNTNIQNIDSSTIRKMFDMAKELKDPINLSIGQPHFSTPPQIKDAIAKAIQDGHTAYSPSQGLLPLREALAQKLQKKNKISAHPDHILVSSGVASLIQLLFMTCVEKGDPIVLTDPNFLIYNSLASYFGADVSYIPENFQDEDIQQLEKKPFKLIIISNPSNPSGYIFDKKQMASIVRLAEANNSLLVSDEIYEGYDYDKKFMSIARLYPQTLTLSGFSKSYSMTGLRLGSAYGPPPLIQAMTKLQQYTIVCAPTPVQYGGIEALGTDMSSYVEDYQKKRDFALEKLSPHLDFSYPSGAFYIFAKIPERDEDFVQKAIQEKQLLLVPGRIFSHSSQNYIRLSYGVEKNTLERGLEALLELLK